MIRTRFGSPVTVERVNLDTGEALGVKRRSDGTGWDSLPLCELRADGGLDEIIQHARERHGVVGE